MDKRIFWVWLALLGVVLYLATHGSANMAEGSMRDPAQYKVDMVVGPYSAWWPGIVVAPADPERRIVAVEVPRRLGAGSEAHPRFGNGITCDNSGNRVAGLQDS